MLPVWRTVVADDTNRNCKYSGEGVLPFGTKLVLVDHDLDMKSRYFREHKNPLFRNIQKRFCEMILHGVLYAWNLIDVCLNVIPNDLVISK